MFTDGGENHVLRNRPCPAVCSSAMTTVPSGAPSCASPRKTALVDGTESSSLSSRPTILPDSCFLIRSMSRSTHPEGRNDDANRHLNDFRVFEDATSRAGGRSEE